MDTKKLSPKGQQLIELYTQMAKEGYEREDGEREDVAFSYFELRAYRTHMAPLFKEQGIRSVLDYGCGGSDWTQKNFHPETGQCAQDYFGLDVVNRYEPARALDQREVVDAVLCFDVLEHIFISDIPNMLRDIFSYARKLVILNIALYPAAAKLANGENAHITLRDPQWWKGMVDAISVEYPQIQVYLICSQAWHKSINFPMWRAEDWQQQEGFVVKS
ncbi:hypothetical protein [Magnetococcus sp. PR-3]|uniref:hypothetical protein n=1 Tax=Magnetococcus sp. PR-3 TaxID=3120355 RepID=UPI002FCDF4FE